MSFKGAGIWLALFSFPHARSGFPPIAGSLFI
ncbi:hypothetical protein ABIE64_000275 [Thalassospira sp. MBR-102]|uniref:Uncharacterized protein n=1 Tax=Thalassospira permensis NBRC 106175 TaxID=1353532 RepID=A0ABR4TID5_9PROT|nr:hypothetical protein SMB34_08900 [Thalassospira permensis NBRC 106175]